MELHFILSNFSSLVKSQAEQSKAEGRDVSSKQGNCYLPILVVGGHVSLEEAFFCCCHEYTSSTLSWAGGGDGSGAAVVDAEF